MTGMKEKLGDKYPQWYARHRLVENQRVWRKIAEDNPMNTIPEFERVLPETYSLIDAFYHSPGCRCGSCVGTLGALLKPLHKRYFKSEPWVRVASSPRREPPHRVQQLLLSVEAEVLSRSDLLASLQSESD